MAFPPHAFSTTDGAANSEWEVHKLAAVGLRRLGAYVIGTACMLFALSFFQLTEPAGLLDSLKSEFGDDDRLRDLFEGLTSKTPLPLSLVSARWALVACAAAGLGLIITARIKKNELHHPVMLAGAVTWSVCAVGAFATAGTGGLGGALGVGMVPFLWTWAWSMPGGRKKALLPVAGGAAIHVAIAMALTHLSFSPAGIGTVAAVFLSVGATLVAAQAIETWRVKANDVSQTDWLTGALSRRALEERLGALCAQRQRSLAPLALVMFDIDRFRSINDKHGRAAGDELLEMLVSGIKAEIRASDFLGRYGGDEFLLVLDECEGASAVSLLERLRERFGSKPISVKDAQVRVSFSAGVVSVGTGDPLELRELLRSAERALEASKEAGRNRTSVAPPPPPGASSLVSAELVSEPLPDDEEATVAVDAAPLPKNESAS